MNHVISLKECKSRGSKRRDFIIDCVKGEKSRKCNSPRINEYFITNSFKKLQISKNFFFGNLSPPFYWFAIILTMQGKAQNHIGIKAHERYKGLAQGMFEHGPIMIKLVAHGSTKHKSLHQFLFIYSLVHMKFSFFKKPKHLH